ncbi:MAG: beta-lactamase family protein [Planctomycetes bacterium]|nr:beta-lactamase family protein [Planctomycetota bacterium]
MPRIHRRTLALLVTAVATVVATASTAHAQQSPGPYKDVRGLPQTPGGKCVKELMDVINAGDHERFKQFISERFSPAFRDAFPLEQHLAVFDDVRERSGGLDFHGIREYERPRSDNEIVAILKERLTDAWTAFIIEVEPQPPHRIARLRFAPARPPSDIGPPTKLTEAELLAELRTFLDRLAKADAFSGTVMLAKDDRILFEQAYGLASKRFDVPNRIDTKFNLGSMNKMFTAVAIAQLVERSQLSFDDPLSKHLGPDWLPAEIADKITISHLLSHTSGLGSHFTDEFQNSSRLLFRTVNDWRPLLSQQTLAFEPGSEWRYSNAGFYFLGALIEKVTGQDYYDYIREHVYRPAGMTNSDSYDMDRPIPNLAIGYTKQQTPDGSVWTNNTFQHTIRGGPAGGGFSTVEDLRKFDQALRHNKLLGAKYTELLWTPKPNSPDYGYGFGLQGTPDNRIVGHSGGFPGISANLSMYLDTGYTSVVLSNYDRAAATVTTKIRELHGRLQRSE